jgi:hypothetical protein
MATYERKLGFTDSEPLTPDDHDAILAFHDTRGQEQGIMDYALAPSRPPHRGARIDPPLKPTGNKFVDLSSDADLFDEIMR